MPGFDIKNAPDIATIEDEGRWEQVRDINGDLMWEDDEKKKPVRMLVVGSYSKTYIEMQQRQSKRMSRGISRGGELDIDQNSIDLLAVCVKKWEGFSSGSEAFVCNYDNVKALLTSDKAQHIKTQVQRWVMDHERFFASAVAS